ncbi:MAG TPA: hypothetical protein VML50_02030 [Anaeromyxobacter sp.]|nr:hypothetical protein [Anaeromyxobacter sp.]
MGRTCALLLAGLLLASCRRSGEDEARAAVANYLVKLVQAYRSSDETIVDPFVTEAQGRTLTGLIGVKQDMGVLLDSQLLDIRFESVRVDGEGFLVDTRERWHYRDLALRTGTQVGDDSLDSYAIRYRLVREEGKLKIAQIEFREPPAVGRKLPPVQLRSRAAHGLPTPEGAEAPTGPGASSPGAAGGR